MFFFFFFLFKHRKSNNRIRDHEVWSLCSRDIFGVLHFSDREKAVASWSFHRRTLRPSNGYSPRSASYESHFVELYSEKEDAALSARYTLLRLYFLALSLIVSKCIEILVLRIHIEIPIPIYLTRSASYLSFAYYARMFHARSNRTKKETLYTVRAFEL